MRSHVLAIGGLLLWQGLISPVLAENSDALAYAPDIVGVGRIFMVALKAPVDAPQIAVKVPDCVEMFDRTPLPAKSELRKYYFRSLKPAKRADVVFAHPTGPITVSIEIWSLEDLRQFRTLKGVQLPRRWPLGEELPELKEAQTITTDVMRQAAKGKDPGQRWLTVPDEDIWNMQPDSTIPRWHWVNVKDGCPVHGTEIYRGRAFYPWSWEYTLPLNWKIKCPVGGEKYPSNDFANGDMTSGQFPDDGIGGGCDYNGERYGFIAELCQAYCRYMLSVAPACADSYLATGDIRYAHKALVAMSRIAVEYAYLATMTQHRHRNTQSQVERLGPAPFSEGPCLAHSGLTTYMIHFQGAAHAEAYDKIFPAIEQDTQIIPFLQSKGLNVNTHDDVRRFIEENLFAVLMQALMDGATHANPPVAEEGLVRVAAVLNYRRGDELMDWVYDGPNGMRFFLTNSYFRDGSPYESTGGYNGIHVDGLGPIVEAIEHLRHMRPELYPEEKYPNFTKSRRYHQVFDFSMNTVNIDRTYPRVGDEGTYPSFRKLPKRTWQNGAPAAFEHAYKVFKDPKLAWALVNNPTWQPSPQLPYTAQELKQQAAQWPDQWNDASCLQDGYGLAMLRSGEGDGKRALWMMYGRARWHTHDDIMHIGLDAYQSEILGQMGYPRNWNSWYTNWITHIQARQFPTVQMTATSQLFADAGPAHVCEAYAQGFSDATGQGGGYEVFTSEWQRRMLAIIDVSAEQFYCLDLYRIHGGKEQWWTFHAQEGDFTTAGLDLTRQEGGTLAGPDVPYGDEKWLQAAGCGKSIYGYNGPMFGFAHLYNVQRAKPAGVWSADWALRNADGLHFRMTVPESSNSEVIIADGTCPAGGNPYEMKWVLLHNQADEPTKTQVVNVMELYRANPLIRSVRPLQLSGEDESGFEPYGCVIELNNGRTDTIFASADGAVLRAAPGGFEFAGRFGLYSEHNGLPTHVALIGGTRLTRNGIGIATDSAEYRGTITAVDRPEQSITVSPAPDCLDALVGRYIYITNPVRRIAYKVLEARSVAAGAELRLEFDSRIGTGKVSGHDANLVKTSTPFPLSRYRYYHGARLLNAAGTAEYRLIEVRSDRGAIIDASVHPEAAADKLAVEFPTDTWFEVYDYGVGDEVVFPHACSVTLTGLSACDITATTKLTATLLYHSGVRTVKAFRGSAG